MARSRTYSRSARQAAQLLGAQIQLARQDRRWTEAELAQRAGITRPTLRKIERGEMNVALGLAFEVAAVAGVRLFHDESAQLGAELEQARARLALLPRQVKPKRRTAKHDF